MNIINIFNINLIGLENDLGEENRKISMEKINNLMNNTNLWDKPNIETIYKKKNTSEDEEIVIDNIDDVMNLFR